LVAARSIGDGTGAVLAVGVMTARPAHRRPAVILTTIMVVATLLTGTAAADPVPPSPTAVTPTLVQAGATAVAVHVDGSGFVDGASLTDAQGDVTFAQVTVTGDSGIDAVADVAATPSKLGLHTIVVTNPDGSTGQCAGCLTVAQVPAAPTSVHTSAIDHGMVVSWRETFPGTQVTSTVRRDNGSGSAGSTQLLSPAFSVQVHNLVPGDVYTVSVSATNALGTGPETTAQGRPAAVPDKPVIASSRLGDRSITVYPVTPNDYGVPVDYWQATVSLAGSGIVRSNNFRPGHAIQFTQLDAGTAYDVVVSAKNWMGMSAPSDPLRLTVVAVPGEPRDVWYSFADGRLGFHWQAPASDGGVPVDGYDIWFGPSGSDAPTHYSVTGTSFSIGRVVPGTEFNFAVSARNAIGIGVQGYPRWMGVAGYARVTALDSHGHARWRRTDVAGWHSLGGTFATPPSVLRTSSGRVFYVGADGRGQLSIRTDSTGWRRVGGARCFRPVLREDFYSLQIGCRSTRGTLLIGEASTEYGPPVFSAEDWQDSGRRIVGAPAAVDGGFVVRTSAWDTAGHDIRYFDRTTFRWHRVRLTCDGEPVADATAAFVACLGSGRVRWGYLDGYAPAASIAPPARPVGVMGGAYWGAGAIAISGADGHLWLLDAGQRQWRRLGPAPASGVRMATWHRGVS
jgi:hypothetical protein